MQSDLFSVIEHMEFRYLFLACAFFALQFIFQKLFEKRTVGGISVCMWNQLVFCTVSVLFLIVKTGGAFSKLTLPAFLFGLLYSLSSSLGCIVTIMAMNRGKVGTVGAYSMAGGMVIPFIYGIAALSEEASLFKWLGIVILTLSLLPSVMTEKPHAEKGEKGKRDIRLIFLTVMVFLANGFVSIFSKMHQISPAAIDEDSFLLLTGIQKIVIALVILIAAICSARAQGSKTAATDVIWSIGRKTMTGALFSLLVLIAGTYAICNTLGNLFSLKCMAIMDASIQFPLLSAIVILLSALFGRLFFGEKITRTSWIGLAMSAAGIGVFMLA